MASLHSPYKLISCESEDPRDWEVLQQAIDDTGTAQRLELMGLRDIAEPLHLKALAAKERMVGCPEISKAISYNALGAMYTRMGRLDEAKSYLEKALRIREGNRDCHELDAAATRMYLAKVLEMQGDLNGAKDLRKLGWPKKMFCGNEQVQCCSRRSRVSLPLISCTLQCQCPRNAMFRADLSLCSRCKVIF